MPIDRKFDIVEECIDSWAMNHGGSFEHQINLYDRNTYWQPVTNIYTLYIYLACTTRRLVKFNSHININIFGYSFSVIVKSGVTVTH